MWWFFKDFPIKRVKNKFSTYSNLPMILSLEFLIALVVTISGFRQLLFSTKYISVFSPIMLSSFSLSIKMVKNKCSPYSNLPMISSFELSIALAVTILGLMTTVCSNAKQWFRVKTRHVHMCLFMIQNMILKFYHLLTMNKLLQLRATL